MQVTIDLEHLIEFLNEVRVAGFDISTQQYIAAQDLLLALAANGQLPDDPNSLKTLFAPIVCSTPQEQENFYRYFERWVKRNPDAAIAVAADSFEAFERRRNPGWIARFRKPVLVAASIILCVGLVVTIVQRLGRMQSLTITGRVVDNDNSLPLARARISFAEQILSSNSDGQFSITYRKKELPTSLVVRNEGYETTTETIPSDTSKPMEVRMLPLLPPPDVSPDPTPTPPKTQPSTPGTRSQNAIPATVPSPTPVTIALMSLPTPPPTTTQRLTWIGYTAAMFPFLLFIGWWVWKTRLSRAFLQKLQRVTEPRVDQFIVKGGSGRLFQGPSFRRTIQELRRHRQRGASELDAQRTVSKTVQSGGLFTPAYGSRQALPEYLVLIDRATFADQQASLDDEIVRRLVQDNVFVDTYHFQGDPRFCRKQGQNSPYYSLHEIAALHPDHYLIVFSDGSTFINPLTGEPERWLEMFASWPSRTLLTPESPAHWGHRERALAELDFIVLPATKEGLASLTELLGGGAPARMECDRRPRPYPALLRDRTTRWLQNHEPQPQIMQRLCDQLKVFLGTKGYEWLSACAVYPQLHWDLTLYLGFNLLRDGNLIEDRMLSLVRLPWFRYGSIPDWLRLRLISDLSPATESSVRKALEQLLLTVIQQPVDGIHLEIASEEKESLGVVERLKKRIATWKSRNVLWQFLRDEPPESPLRDYVFLSFMAGRRPRKLTVSLPDTIRRVIFPQGQAALGMRPASLLVLAIAGSVALSFINWRATRAESNPAETPFFYSQMSAEQQQQFVKDQAQLISARLGSGTTVIPESGLSKIKEFVDAYNRRVGNNSKALGGEDLRDVLGRAIPNAPIIIQVFERSKLPRVLGLYLAMIQSEYRNLEQVDLFDQPNNGGGTDSVRQAAEAAAGHEKRCADEFGSDSAGMTLTIVCFYTVIERLQRAIDSIPELNQNAWFLQPSDLITPDQTSDANLLIYGSILERVPKFFAAAIVGENPQRFLMQMSPLSSYDSIEVISNAPSISDLIAQFTGPERRNASDQLVAMYPQNKAAVIEALINSIVLTPGPNTYRINLYIARTLGMIRPNWEGTSEQLSKLQALKTSADYQDETFKYWVDRAINVVSITPLVAPSPSTSVSPTPSASASPTPSASASPTPSSRIEVQIRVSDRVIRVNAPVVITALSSVPNAQYQFNFGDGAVTDWQASNRASHNYSRRGSFGVSVVVRATVDGSMVQATSPRQTISVMDSDFRIKVLSSASRVVVDEPVRFFAQTPSLALGQYYFSFGDGSSAGWQANPRTEHRYSFPGTFEVAVRFNLRSGQMVLEGSGSTRVVVVAKSTDGIIPNVIGKSESEARQLLNEVGFSLGSVTYKDPRGARISPQGIVLSQRPAPGTRAPAGTRVNIVIGPQN